MIKCPNCNSVKVGRTYIVTTYETVGVNDGEVYEVCEGTTKIADDQTEFYCFECFHEWEEF